MADTETVEKDYTVYAEKQATVLMKEFGDWLVDEVYSGDNPFGTAKELDAFYDGVRLGGTLRMEYQASDFCKTQREARKAERAASNGDAGDEPTETEKPKRGRGAGKAAGAKAGTAKAGTAKGTGRGRGRPRKTEADKEGAAAPF